MPSPHSQLWSTPGGEALRSLLPTWRAQLPKRLAKKLDALVAANLPELVGRVDDWLRRRFHDAVLDALRPVNSRTIREIHPIVGRTLLDVRKALQVHVHMGRAAWAEGRYHILLPGRRDASGYHGLRSVEGIQDMDRRITEVLTRASKPVAIDEIWIDTPGSGRDLLMALTRRSDVGWELRGNEPFYYLKTSDSEGA